MDDETTNMIIESGLSSEKKIPAKSLSAIHSNNNNNDNDNNNNDNINKKK